MNEKVLLCVDDELSIQNSLKRLLRHEEFTVLTASSAEEGLRILEKVTAHLVISDQRMPEMTGTEFLQKVKELYPDTVRVILSAYADAKAILDAINCGEVYRFFTKPWDDEELKINIRQCFEHYDLLQAQKYQFCHMQAQNEKLNSLTEELARAVISERANTINVAQEIINIIQTPVLTLTEEGMILLINQSFFRAFPRLSQTTFGTDIRTLFPNQGEDFLSKILQGDADQNKCFVEMDGGLIQLESISLAMDSSLKRCVLMLKVMTSQEADERTSLTQEDMTYVET